MRSAPHGGSAPQLALSARSPRGCLWSHIEAMAGLKPSRSGFRMPAEWEPHEATWLAWPHERTDWLGKFAPIPWVYGDIVQRLARVERVRILVEDAALEKSVRRVLAKCAVDMSAVEFFRWPTNRSWTRDYCPIFVRNPKGEIAIT